MVFGETLETYNKRLRRVLKRLLDANLTDEPKKCQFLKHEAHVLGYIVGEGMYSKVCRERYIFKSLPISPIRYRNYNRKVLSSYGMTSNKKHSKNSKK